MRTTAVHCMILISGLIIFSAACKKHTGADNGTGNSSNIYVLGTVGDTLMYWKNGEAHGLYAQSRSFYNLSSSSLFVSGDDAYVSTVKLDNNSTTLRYIPAYWKNDASVALSNPSGEAFTNSIFVSNNDVYVSGISHYFTDTSHVPYTTPDAAYPPFGTIATIWKNGVPASLPGYGTPGYIRGSTQYAVRAYNDYVSSLFVSGSDVYVSGGSLYAGYTAMYWKNGVRTDLTKGLIYTVNGNDCWPHTTSIYVSGNDVYVAGYQVTSFVSVALFWKNGVPAYLTTDSIHGSVANSVFASGNTVYVAGYQNINGYARAMIWKNGVPATLTTDAPSSTATSIVVAGDDVYVAGYQWTAPGPYIATYWKNGAAVKLTNGKTSAIANSIYIQ